MSEGSGRIAPLVQFVLRTARFVLFWKKLLTARMRSQAKKRNEMKPRIVRISRNGPVELNSFWPATTWLRGIRTIRGMLSPRPRFRSLPFKRGSGVQLPDKEFLRRLSGQTLRPLCRKTRRRDPGPRSTPSLDLNGMITNVIFRVERELDLPGRRRTDKANQFILEHLPELQRELQVRRLPQTMSNQLRRSVKE